jgi:hypothetical protein
MASEKKIIGKKNPAYPEYLGDIGMLQDLELMEMMVKTGIAKKLKKTPPKQEKKK